MLDGSLALDIQEYYIERGEFCWSTIPGHLTLGMAWRVDGLWHDLCER